MELIIIIAIGAVIWFLFHLNKKNKKVEIPLKVTIETKVNGVRYDPKQVVDTGEISQINENTFCINPKSPFPITLSPISIADAKNVKRMLNGEAQWERNLSDIAFLFAQKNVECLELNEFIVKARSETSSYINKEKIKSEEWLESSEQDREDIILELQMAAVENMSERPADTQALETLIFNMPQNVTVDDQLLNIFSGKEDLYRFYISYIGYNSKVNQIAADDYNRKQWEALAELGLAKRGKDIPLTEILNGLRVKDINDYFSDRLKKKITRKAAAIEFATSQPDVLDVLSKHMSFRELFLIVEPAGIDMSSLRVCYAYANAQAKIIKDTYVSGYRTLNTLNEAHDAGYDGWEIEAEDCCSQCSKLHHRKTKRKPAKLPPFHIGCTCSLNGTYD
ncbi:MAG TPA: hypothetical protein PLG94_17640 [Smithellaceae bacterium]|mgnify:FL=1|nr:hypothetical protein [Smithellaceae bacterium]